MAKIVYASFGEDMIFTGKIFPKAKLLGKGEIKNYRLMFKGDSPLSYATIEPEENYFVPVMLWEIPADESEIPVVQERIISNLTGTRHKLDVEVEITKDKIVNAITFVLSDELPLAVPDTHYVEAIWECYKRLLFDEKILYEAEEFSDRRGFFVRN